jgi:hypothetical protein
VHFGLERVLELDRYVEALRVDVAVLVDSAVEASCRQWMDGKATRETWLPDLIMNDDGIRVQEEAVDDLWKLVKWYG